MSKVSRNDLINVVLKSKKTLDIQESWVDVGDDVPLVKDLFVILQGDRKLLEHCAKISGETPTTFPDYHEQLITMSYDVPRTGRVPDHIYLSVWG